MYINKILGKPVNTKQSALLNKITALVKDLNLLNVELEDSSLYNGHAEFSILVNFNQNTVKSGYPVHAIIYCDLITEDKQIRISQMAETFDEEKDIHVKYADEIIYDFTWQRLEDLIIEYSSKTYL